MTLKFTLNTIKHPVLKPTIMYLKLKKKQLKNLNFRKK